MLHHDQEADEHGAESDDFQGRVAGGVQEIHKERERGGGGDGTQRRVAPENYNEQPENRGGCYGLPAYWKEYAEARSDSLATFESQPYGEHVSYNGKDGGDHHPANIAGSEATSEPDGKVTFSGVKNEGENSGEFSGIAGNVGGADVAAADLADVWAAEGADDEQAKGNGAQEIGADGNDDSEVGWHETHCDPLTNGNVATFLYFAPIGCKMLSIK